MSSTTTTTTASKTAASTESHKFYHDEIVFIENVLVELRSRIPNDQGENTEILEKIVLAEQIIGARLDTEATTIGDSA